MSKDAITIFAIDPGPEQSAYVRYKDRRVIECDIVPNDELERRLESVRDDVFACEWIESFGMAVGKSVFETCYAVGRFSLVGELVRVGRRAVKLHLCNSARAKDANVRQALIDRFPATGGGKTPQIGTKKQPGPLFGVKSHIWSALAVAVTVAAEKEQ